jgi:hypothetical protein
MWMFVARPTNHGLIHKQLGPWLVPSPPVHLDAIYPLPDHFQRVIRARHPISNDF